MRLPTEAHDFAIDAVRHEMARVLHTPYAQVDPFSWDINDGFCDVFAEALAEELGEVRHLSGEDHACVEWAGRFYEAGCMDGVDDPSELPSWKNRGTGRPTPRPPAGRYQYPLQVVKENGRF